MRFYYSHNQMTKRDFNCSINNFYYSNLRNTFITILQSTYYVCWIWIIFHFLDKDQALWNVSEIDEYISSGNVWWLQNSRNCVRPVIKEQLIGFTLGRPSLPPVDLYLISEKSIWKNQVWRTGFLVYFELDSYCLCSLHKSISKLIFKG